MSERSIAIGKRIASLRKDVLKLTGPQLAERLSKHGEKFDKGLISRYENGKVEPKQRFYDSMEKEFGYKADYFTKGIDESDNDNQLLSDNDNGYIKRVREQPIYGEVLCGAPASQWRDEGLIKYIPTDVKDKTAFGVIAKGTSMEPYINDKDILICVDNPHLIKNKSAVVTVFKSEPDTTNTNAKLIMKNEKRKEIILYSINTRNPPEIYHESDIIKIYKVVRIIREVK